MSKEERNTYKIESDENLGEVQIADEVVAIIAGLAAMEVEGVSSMAGNATRELIAKLGMKSLSKGVKVDVLEGIVTVSLALNLKYGSSIKDTTLKVLLNINDIHTFSEPLIYLSCFIFLL